MPSGNDLPAASPARRLRLLVQRGLWSLLKVYPGEVSRTLMMATFFFLVVASHYVIKPVRNSLFVEHVGADNLPYVYIGTALVIGILISAYTRYVVGRLSPRRLIAITYASLAGVLLLFFWLVQHKTLAGSAAFYVWAKLYPVLAVSQFWLMGNALFEPRQAKRLFGVIGAGGILGGIAGSALAGSIAELAGTENLLLVSAGATAACAGLATRVHPASMEPSLRTEARVTAGDEAPLSASALVRQSPHLRAISILLTLAIVVSTMVDWQLNKAVELFVAGEDAKTAFYGRFFALLNITSLFVQLLFTSFVLRRFGIGAGLLLLPLGLFAGALGVLLHPALLTASLAKGVDGTLRHSLDQSTRELLFLPVPHAIKRRAKPFIDVAVERSGTGIGGLVILLTTGVAAVPFQYMSVVILGVALAWMATVFRVRREYVRSIKQQIQAREHDIDDLVLRTIDADHVRELLTALEGDDPERVLYALELLELGGAIPEHGQHLTRLLKHPHPEVRERTAAVLAAHGDHVLLRAIDPLLQHEDIQVRVDALRLVCRHCVEDELVSYQRLLADPRARVRAGAIAGYYADPEPRLSGLAAAHLHKLAGESGPGGGAYRREAALLTAVLPPGDPIGRVLLALLDDPDESVRRAAALSAGRGVYRETIPALVRELSTPRLRDEARRALAGFGEAIVDALSDRLRDPGQPPEIRQQLARLLGTRAFGPAIDQLLRALDARDTGVRYHILKALNRARHDDPHIVVPAGPVERALRVELGLLAHLLAVRAWLQPRSDTAGDRLLVAVLDEREDDAVERITRCLGMLYPLDDLFHAYQALTERSQAERAFGIELLDNLLQPAHRQAVIPLLERSEGVVARASRPHALELPDWDPWLGSCLAFVDASRSTSRDRALPQESKSMMAIVERADFLRNVKIFTLVRTEYLAKVAAVLKERELAAGETLFAQGSSPEAIYFVVEGEIEAVRDGQQAWVARRGDTLAVLPVLDRSPTLVSAVAAAPSRLLLVREELFNDLMLDNPALQLGIIRFLAGEVRRLSSEGRPSVLTYS